MERLFQPCIDELPIISVLACFAKGETIIKDAAELKVKESNRLDVCVNHLTAMNADVTATEDGNDYQRRKASSRCNT